MSDPVVFSTRADHPSERVKAWSRYLSETYFGLGAKSKDDNVIGDIVARGYGATSLSSVRMSSNRVMRSRQSASLDKVERFCFLFPTSGMFEHRQHGVENKSSVGSVFILNSAEPYEVDISDAGSNVTLTVPSDRIRSRLRGIDDQCAKSTLADPKLLASFRHLIQATLVEGLRSEAMAFEDLCLDMLELMLSRSKTTHLLPANFKTSARRGLLS